MPLRLTLVEGDVLDQAGDCLLLTLDGAGVKMIGNLARQLAKRFPDIELEEEIESQVDFPFPLGVARLVELPEPSPYRQAILISTLHHGEQLDDAGKRATVRTAFAAALELAASRRITRLLTTVLAGGWRLPQAAAFQIMLGVLADPAQAGPEELVVCARENVAALRETGRGQWFTE